MGRERRLKPPTQEEFDNFPCHRKTYFRVKRPDLIQHIDGKHSPQEREYIKYELEKLKNNENTTSN